MGHGDHVKVGLRSLVENETFKSKICIAFSPYKKDAESNDDSDVDDEASNPADGEEDENESIILSSESKSS